MNDVIGALVDMQKYTITFLQNGKILGRGLALPQDAKLVPIIGLCGGQTTLQIKEPPKIK